MENEDRQKTCSRECPGSETRELKTHMEKRLYLHIGGPKTGTTALQLFLARNRQALAERGYCYPGTADAHWGICANLREHSLDGIRARPNTFIRRCLEEIQKSSCHTAVMSAECLADCSEVQTLRELIPRTLPVTVVYYARRQDALIESWYHEVVKSLHYRNGNTLDDEYLRQIWTMRLFDHARIITPWAESFGRENMTVRVYENRQMQGDIIGDFSRVISLSPDASFRLPADYLNTRLDLHRLEFIRICNRALTDGSEINRFLLESRFFERKIFKPLKNQHLLLPDARIAILDYFEESNQRVAREYLGREDGCLFYDPRPDPAEPWIPYPGLTAEALDRIFGELLGSLDRQQQEMEPLGSILGYLSRAACRGVHILPGAIRRTLCRLADRNSGDF